jgi:hypothetical protein
MLHAIFRSGLLMLLLISGSSAVAFAAGNRVALVIGNAAYRHAAVLANPANDAADMAAVAEKLGFTVIRGLDLDKAGMDRTIRQFAEALRGASMGMFFYAGHGLQVSGRNYLVPIDAELKTAEALDFEMTGLDVVQRIMETASETNVLFVDACRDNPLSRNLARAMGTRSAVIGNGLTAQEAGAGTLISFSTQPGNVAMDGTGSRNSPYAAALVKHITTAGKDLPALLVQVRRDVMATTGKRQIPWEHSALTAEVMLAQQASVQTSANAAPKIDALKADVAKKNESDEADDISSDAEPKTPKVPEVKTAANDSAEPAGNSESPKRTVTKVIKPGILRLASSSHSHSLYDEAGTHRMTQGLRGDVELPQGKYHLQDSVTLHMSIGLFEIKPGEVTDLNQISGYLTVKGVRHGQQVYDATGTNRLSTVPFRDGIHLPPGRYFLEDSETNHMSAQSFEIKAGQSLDINQVSGILTFVGAKNSQYIYNEAGTDRLTRFPTKGGVHLPAGRYRLIDSRTNLTSVDTFEIKVGEETVLDFGG